MKETGFDMIFDSQKIFRLLLDAFAHPGKIAKITDLQITPPPGMNKMSAGVLLALLDLEVGFAVVAGDKKQGEKIEQYLILNTGCGLKNLESADFILARDELPPVNRIKKGSLEYPDQGATIVYSAEEISESLSGVGAVNLTLAGPGIKGKRSLALRGLDKREILKIMEINKEFPLGADFVFTDNQEGFCALPRSTKIVEVKEA